MPLGHLLAGGLASTHLFGIYVVHSVASLAYHLFPCRETYWTDTSLINLLLMERVYRKTAHPAVYGVGLLSMVLEPVKSHTWVAARSAVAAYVGDVGYGYHGCFLLCGVVYAWSSYSTVSHPRWSSFLYGVFHLGLGVFSYKEVEAHVQEEDDLSLGMRCLVYSLFGCYVACGLIS
jgi:hypothetical protein